MAFRRYLIDLAIPLDEQGKLPPSLNGQINAIHNQIRILKSFSQKINEGKFNQEMTIKAKYHVCHHDSEKPCEPEIDI